MLLTYPAIGSAVAAAVQQWQSILLFQLLEIVLDSLELVAENILLLVINESVPL